MTIKTLPLGPGTLKLNVARSIASVTTTNASATITTAVPRFLTGDVGVPISGTGIPGGATILAVVSPYQATLSANATASGTVTLTVTPAAVTDVSCQVRSCQVVPTENVTTLEALDMLCGEQLPAEDSVTYSYQLQANLLQDFSASGFIDYCWTNKGKQVYAEFVPNTALGRKVSGPVRVAPVAIGGEVKQRALHDIAWTMPVFDPVLA